MDTCKFISNEQFNFDIYINQNVVIYLEIG